MTVIGTIDGYASVFNVEDRSGDIIAPGAFRKGLVKGPSEVKMLYQHAPESPVGRWRRIEEDSRGLWVEGEIVLASASALDVYELIAGGAIDGLSIGFRTIKAAQAKNGKRILEADLWEVSIVTFPMAPGARIARVGAYDLDQGLADAVRGAALNLTV